jgi:23S rRNA maturation-related 3'-5' exoribonuclease YhaM
MSSQKPLYNSETLGNNGTSMHILKLFNSTSDIPNTLNPYNTTLAQAVNTLKNLQKIAPNMCISGKGNGFIKYQEVEK